MLADFFSSKNISKDALDILTAILKLKNMISSQTSGYTTSASQNTATATSAEKNISDDSSVRSADLLSMNSGSKSLEELPQDLPVRVIPSAQTEADTDTDTDAADTNTDTNIES